jgi:PAS domain S-box-containing protein
MARSARLQEAILDGTVDAVLTVDGDARILDANRTMLELLGSRDEELRGSRLDDLPIQTPGERRELTGGLSAHLDTLGPTGGQLDLLIAGRAPIPIWLSATTARLDAALYRVLTIRDLRRERELQEQLIHAQKIESVGHLTGGVAHDFNNLLTVIAGNAAMLEDASGADRADLVSGIQAAARRGADLTGRLLAFARKQPLRPAPTEVAEVLASATPMIERLIGERYRIQTSIAEDLPPIHVDAAQLDAAILNLAVNARDAMPQGGRIGIRARTTIRDGRQHVAIEVSDTGPGVPAEIRGQIFDPFFTTKETGSGTGLGLSMVHGFVRQSGGSLSLSEIRPSGAVFELDFPALEPTRARTRDPEPEIPSESLDDHALRVLIVEDDEMVRTLAARTLRALGHVTVEASDPERALEMLEQDPAIELLFTDMVLASELSGLDLARRTMQMRPELPVVITSGYTEYGDDISALPERILFLPKPYTLQQVRSCFRRAMALSG